MTSLSARAPSAASGLVQPGTVDVLGVPVAPLSWDQLLGRVGATISAAHSAAHSAADHDAGRSPASRLTIAYANVHVLNTAARDGRLTRILQEVDICFCDGNGVRTGARILGQDLPHRMTGADWIWDLADAAEGQWRIWWIGGKPGVTVEAAEVLRSRHPRLEIGTDHGFHKTGSEDSRRSLERIRAFKPDIVLVGMGTPIQEYWTDEHRDELDAPVVWCLGATADFVTGRVPRGPRWLTDRVEWAGRLVAEPGRLWRRYLVGNPVFLARALAQRLGRPQTR